MVRSNLVSISVGYPMPLQIILKNTQSVASPSPFQQMLQLEASEINSVLPSSTPKVASDFHNIRFKYNNSYIPAWLESISNGVATIWVLLPVSIPANSSITIDMEIDPSLNFDGNYWGENPLLSPTYGQYDNGANVFINYWNFAGTTVPSGWNIGSAFTVNNGLIALPNEISNAFYSVPSVPPIIEDFYANLPANKTNMNQGFGFRGSSGTLAWFNFPNWGLYSYNGNGSSFISTNTYAGLGIYSIYYESTSFAALSFNYGPLVDNANPNSVPSSITIGGYQINSVSYTVYWVRTRAYPPNGVMPSVEVIV